ncbi:Bifunctional polynucleotide phosphatase/kinase [Nosema bombycis CQ1]|uniref:Bifunctional polynucleotide phosphatase/kinase n=1 Tax=Nosema bombycis (strain CQ1 / CVCC 102059) TaxID=578461 RepID=R0KWC0_NOSB1|nr:Bifunctional polynucleotide phosphatase/kinase [Nosema bombycis CQ1]|eukprot:EOB14507.1 Bifunctional polynucleotide phosphatase/kinase [Nosema bombycis CQ1]
MLIIEDSLLVLDYGLTKNNFTKLAMFDFDNTLATYSNFDNIATWRFQYKNVNEKLFQLNDEGYKIVIMSNQSQIKSNQKIYKDFLNKINEFHKALDLPTLVLVALRKDKYRKPCIWSYKWLKTNYFPNNDLIDKFYVGDAAGERKGAPYPINCDLYFAKNVGMKFYLPEEFFLNKLPNYVFDPIDIRSFKSCDFIKKEKRIIFLFSLKKHNGKNFFIRKYYPDHKIFQSPQAYSKECIYVNCNNLAFIKKVIKENPNDFQIYLLDYPPRVESWLKEFYSVNGQFDESKPFTSLKPGVIEYIRDKCEKVPFTFDDSNFNSEELEISKLYLE